MKSRSIWRTVLFIGLSLQLFGCATQLAVQVSAIADPAVSAASMRYVLLNGNAEGQENDLFFREFSAYFIPVLAQKGYQKVASREQADIEIFLRYAVSDGRVGIHTFAHPLYETFGGNTITFTETKTDSGGVTTTTQGTVHVPLQTQYVGTVLERSSYVEYTSSVALEAYRIDAKDTQQRTVLWKTLISSTSESNDLRSMMPVMAAAAAPYLASNSGATKTVRLQADDPRVLQIRQQASQ